jgi:hypothetical protein
MSSDAEVAMTVWTTGWEIEFPAETADEVLLALVVRDLAHGASFDVESVDADAEFAIDFTAGDERDGDVYRLLLAAEVDGHDDAALIQSFTEQMLEEMLEEAEALVSARTEVGDVELAGVELRAVPDDEERWDLVMPDWLAPDGAEVPFGFRGFDRRTGDPVPDNPTLDAHGRVVAFDHRGRYLMVGIPAPAEGDDG